MTIKKALFFLTLSILLGGCASQKQLDNFKCGLSPIHYKVEAPLAAYESNRFFIKVKIQGEDYNFMVSTGHHFCMIDKSLAEKLGYKTFQKEGMELCTVPKLNIGKLDYSSTLMQVFDLKNADCGCTKVDGYIGTNLMSLSLWQLDYPNEKIIIASHSDSLQFAANKQVVNFHTLYTNYGIPVVNLSINQNYYYDVGVYSAFCVSIELPTSSFNPLADSLAQLSTNALLFKDKKQEKLSEKAIKVKGLTIGENVPIDKFWVMHDANNSWGGIGNYILKHFVTTFDWKKQLMTFSSPQIVNNQMYGFTLNNKDSTYMVTSLIKGSFAEKMGLQLGDKIIKFNDVDISKFTAEQLEDFAKEYRKKYWEYDKKGSFPTIKLSVQRDGEVKNFDIGVEDSDKLFVKNKK